VACHSVGQGRKLGPDMVGMSFTTALSSCATT
jgi:hypothetical protein